MSILSTLRFVITHPLNRANPAGALLRLIKWQIGSRLVTGDILHPWLNGIRFAARPGETGVTQNIYCGLQEFHETAYVLHVTNAEDLFIDIGANAGAYTLLACGVRGARGYAWNLSPQPTPG